MLGWIKQLFSSKINLSRIRIPVIFQIWIRSIPHINRSGVSPTLFGFIQVTSWSSLQVSQMAGKYDFSTNSIDVMVRQNWAYELRLLGSRSDQTDKWDPDRQKKFFTLVWTIHFFLMFRLQNHSNCEFYILNAIWAALFTGLSIKSSRRYNKGRAFCRYQALHVLTRA